MSTNKEYKNLIHSLAAILPAQQLSIIHWDKTLKNRHTKVWKQHELDRPSWAASHTTATFVDSSVLQLRLYPAVSSELTPTSRYITLTTISINKQCFTSYSTHNRSIWSESYRATNCTNNDNRNEVTSPWICEGHFYWNMHRNTDCNKYQTDQTKYRLLWDVTITDPPMPSVVPSYSCTDSNLTGPTALRCDVLA